MVASLFADLRAITVAVGGTPPGSLRRLLLGKDALSDGKGGLFVWNAASIESENDDWIKPSSLTTAQAGRWQRVLFAPQVGISAGMMCAGDDTRLPLDEEASFLATITLVNSVDFQINPPAAGKLIITGDMRVNGKITIYDGTNTRELVANPNGYGNLLHTSSGTGTTSASVISMRRVANTATENPGVITFSGSGATKVFNLLAVQQTGGGSAPVVESITETPNGPTDITSHVFNLPATVSSGDLLLALCTFDGAPTITPPSGWTQLYTQSNGTTLTSQAYARVSNGTEGGTTITFTTSAAENSACQIWRISSWQGTLAGVAAGTAGTATAGTTIDIPAFTPAFGQGNTLWIINIGSSSSQTVVGMA